MKKSNYKIAIIGLGYVGLPLAIEFGKKFEVIGFDLSNDRIKDLNNKIDKTLEVENEEFYDAKYLSFTDDSSMLKDCNVFVVTVPTPIDKNKRPDLGPLISASKIVGNNIKKDDIVIFESTVFPGCTEEECVPVIENCSGLIFNKDFFCGYSPERINPGDKEHKLTSIKKITSGSTIEIAHKVDELYKEIISAGTFKASSIKVAEAAKVIENIQRDVNIALVNEFAIIFNKLNIETSEVLEAAGTKWNFLPFKPGLVGGHCIGVDPYYLTHKAESIGYHPEIILGGRRLNDEMSKYVVSQVMRLMTKKNIDIQGSKILILGLSFKENCPDIRNSKVVDVIKELEEFDINYDVFDPWVDHQQVSSEYGIEMCEELENNKYDGIILAVAHDEFKELGIKNLKSFGKSNCVFYDLKNLFQKKDSDARL